MKYIIKGPDASRLLNRVVTRDMDKLKVGQVYYTPWCDDEGKMIDDGTISRLDETTYRMTSADPSLRWLSMNAVGLEVEITEVTDKVAALSFQGPNTRAVLNRCCESPVDGLKYFRLMQNKLGGIPVTISRTGYTGDLGYEIWMDAEHALRIWDLLMTAGHDYGITPVGILAMDMARVEAGLFMIEVDYTSTSHAWIEPQKSSPLRAGPRLDGEPRQAGLFCRAPRPGTREAGRLRLEVDGPRSGMERHGAPLCGRGPAAADPRHGRACQPARVRWQRPGGLCFDRQPGRRC